MVPLLLSFIAGLASATGFAPLSLWPILLLALAGLMELVARAPGIRSALARGWWFGVGHFALGLNWIATAFTFQSNMPAWLGWIAVLLLSFYLAIFPAVAAGLAWRWAEGRKLVLVLLFAAGWIATEWLRAGLFTGFAWNPLAVALIPTPLAAIASVTGTYALSGVAILVAGGLWLAMRRRWQPALAIILVVAVSAAARLPAASEASDTGPLLRIVQPNIGQQNKWDPNYARENFERLRRLTGEPANEPRLMLWPEAATPDYLGIQPGARTRIARLIGPDDVILTGAVELVFDEEGMTRAAYNSLFALDAEGRILGRYDKAHLVPYGEYLPMRPILSRLGLSRLAPGDLDFLAGPGPRTLDLGRFGSAGVQICYEIIFSGNVVDAANRPDFIFNPSNDAWFGAWGPPQHLAQARLRAIEEGLPVLRATPTGVSAVIDAEGRLLQSLPWREAGAIDARLPAPKPPTLFARFGNALVLLFALLFVGAAIAVRREAR
jgi:apolipoprotein N-acyltransferase